MSAGSKFVWDGEDCPREDCDGELQHQDGVNVMCLSCEFVWGHYKTERQHKLVTVDGRTDARKSRSAGDGGSVRCPDPECDWSIADDGSVSTFGAVGDHADEDHGPEVDFIRAGSGWQLRYYGRENQPEASP